MRWSLLIFFLLLLPTVSADINFEIYASSLDPIVLPSGDCQHLIELQMGANETGANETGNNLILFNLMWDIDSGWSYQGYTATLMGSPVVFDVSEKDDSVSGKHRVTFENSTLQSPPLSTPENLTVVINLTAPNVSLATYTLGVAAVWSFNETNKTEMRKSNLSIIVSKPDLVLDVAFSNPNPTEGEVITVYAEIYNSGGEANNFRVELLVDGASQVNSTISLSADTMDVVEFTWAAIEGTHEIAVIADSDDVIDELDETNNNVTKLITVSQLRPDLALDSSDILFSDDNPAEGDFITISAVISNRGEKDANNFVVEFLLDRVSKANRTLSVENNSENTTQFTWTSTKGTHNITIVADAGNAVEESNETNNEATRQITVEEKPPAEVGPSIGGGGPSPKPEIVLLANSIDYNLSGNLTSFLKNQGIEIVYTAPGNFDDYKDRKFIVILGGPDAYEGVGGIVQEVLAQEEQSYLRTRGNCRMYVKANVWATGQVVMVIAGSGREETRKAGEENRIAVKEKVKGY